MAKVEDCTASSEMIVSQLLVDIGILRLLEYDFHNALDHSGMFLVYSKSMFVVLGLILPYQIEILFKLRKHA